MKEGLNNMLTSVSQRVTQVVVVIFFVLAGALSAQAQVTTGTIRGVVTDPNGAAVPNAKVTITKKSTNVSTTAQTTASGEYQFSDLLVGDDYTITVEAANFKTLTLNDVKVQLNQTTTVPAQLALGAIGETVTVTAGGAELVDTTTQNLSKSFSDRQVVELAQTTTGLGVYNLALIAPNVSSSGGVGVGSGGSVGGQRPRNNDFVVDGIDNNDKGVTGPQVYISPETVQEFTLLSNQYSAEFAHSTGGQFIIATKSGSNEFHGTSYFFFRNRYLNAIDTLNKQPGNTYVRERSKVNDAAGISFIPRSDYDRFGGNFSGPIIKNKLFFFGSYERTQVGNAGGAASFEAPTAQGLTIFSQVPGLSTANLNMFKQFVPVATTAADVVSVDCTAGSAGCVNGKVNAPVGFITVAAPSFFVRKNWVINIDYNQSSKTTHHGRFINNNENSIDTAATLPQFFAPVPLPQKLFSYTLVHTFTPKLSNETRLAFRRSSFVLGVPNIAFPLAGFDQFPNITFDELGLSIGPDGNAPQSSIENNYQIVDNVTYLFGNHSLKFGGDFRKLISPQVFIQRQRGDYDWSSINDFLKDISPDFSERNVGANTYYGDQRLLFAFVQDDWRYRPNLTFNLGLNYAYQQVPFGARQQSLNKIATVPGFISFDSPKAQKGNFAPRVGFAWSPNYSSGYLNRLFGSQGTTSIRAGFSMAYDVIFDNIYILSSPPQFQQTVDVGPGIPNFLKNGGIPNVVKPTGSDPVAARLATTSWIPDQKVPYSLTYTGSIQRQFKKDWSLEVRYLGTRGIHLLTQNRINKQNKVFNGPGGFLPTFLSAPSQATLDALPVSLADINARSNFVPSFVAAGFTGGNLVAFLSNGSSVYHAASAQLTRRFTKGFQMTASYTWSHLIDDTTAEVFSTILSPRRVEDFRNLRAERADSALDHRHRFIASSLYDVPYFSKSDNKLVRALLGGFRLAGTLTFETGEKAVVRSGVDANLNGDNAGDRSIINVAGTPNTFSTVTALLKSCPAPCTLTTAQRTVAYVADNPTGQYIQAKAGALTNAGRNTLKLPGIRNMDFSVFKNFHITEGKFIQFRVDMYNAFNHPQWAAGSVHGGEATSITGGPAAAINNIAANAGAANGGVFNRPDLVYSSNPRIIQMGFRFNF
jgi:Carboxypeptidase regulatory-like domain